MRSQQHKIPGIRGGQAVRGKGILKRVGVEGGLDFDLVVWRVVYSA